MVDLAAVNEQYGLVDWTTPIHFASGAVIAGGAVYYGWKPSMALLLNFAILVTWEWFTDYFEPDRTTPTFLPPAFHDVTAWGSLTDIAVGMTGGAVGVLIVRRLKR